MAEARDMIFPGLSVTAIAVVVAGVVTRRLDVVSFRATLLRSLAGAWAGFLLGAVAGAVVDVFAATGIWVAVVGHAGAFFGAELAAVAPRVRSDRSAHP